MAPHVRKAVLLTAGTIIWLVGAIPERAWTWITSLASAASDHPARAIFIVIGVALIVFAIWEDILDLLGIQTTKRLGTQVKTWLHEELKWPLLAGTQIGKTDFTIETEQERRPISIVKRNDGLPVLYITSILQKSSTQSRELLMRAGLERMTALREEIALELSRLGTLSELQISFEHGVTLQVKMTYFLVIDKTLDRMKVASAAHQVDRAQSLAALIFERWSREVRNERQLPS
jgi:hypothetical protein